MAMTQHDANILAKEMGLWAAARDIDASDIVALANRLEQRFLEHNPEFDRIRWRQQLVRWYGGGIAQVNLRSALLGQAQQVEDRPDSDAAPSAPQPDAKGRKRGSSTTGRTRSRKGSTGA